MENKKGQVGLDTAKAVMLTLLLIAVVGFAIIVLISSLSNSDVSKSSSGSYLVQNESVNGDVDDNPATIVWLTSAEGKSDVKCTGVIFVNETGIKSSIADANFTLTNNGCAVNASSETESDGTNATTWIATYSYTYNLYGDVTDNVTSGTQDFFANATTWFALLAVVVIILIIAIVIFAVNRFGGGNTAGL